MGKLRFVSEQSSVPNVNMDGATIDASYRRRLKVKNPNTSDEDLAEYAFDMDLATRLLVARHPNVSVQTLEKLAGDESVKVRIAVAQHPSTTARILERLLTNFGDDVYICRNIAVHPNATAGILATLAHGEDAVVLYNVARHPNTFSETLGRLLECKYESVRKVARQKSQEIAKKQSSAPPKHKKFVPVNRTKCF